MVLSFKVDEKLKKQLEEFAKTENRSLSNYIVTVLLRHIEAKKPPKSK